MLITRYRDINLPTINIITCVIKIFYKGEIYIYNTKVNPFSFQQFK